MHSTKRCCIRLENLQFEALGYSCRVKLEKSLAIDPQLLFIQTIDSTNLELARVLAATHKPDLFSIVAAEQTAGKGRLDRSWVSEPDGSISLSMLLRPVEGVSTGLIPLFVGSMVARALTKVTEQIALVKWPNDVLIEGKKVCGILSQLTEQGVIAGIGINLSRQKSAPETACSVDDFSNASFDAVLAEVLTQLRSGWTDWLSFGDEFALQMIRESSVTVGKEVRAILPSGEEIIGTAVGIAPDGRLQIQADQLHLLSAADVWHLRN
jgi:BirA family biotin operon repressor/biotin-[acetyl-CoA-carboxylase] ligase